VIEAEVGKLSHVGRERLLFLGSAWASHSFLLSETTTSSRSFLSPLIPSLSHSPISRPQCRRIVLPSALRLRTRLLAFSDTCHPVRPLPPHIFSHHLRRGQGCRPPSLKAPLTSSTRRAQAPWYVSSHSRHLTVAGLSQASVIIIIPTPHLSFSVLSIATAWHEVADHSGLRTRRHTP